MGLSNKQKAFIEQYFICGMNATKAAKEAGYSERTAYSQGSRLLKHVDIARVIKERFDEMAMSADEALARIADHARGDIDELLDENGNLSIAQARENGKTHLIKSISKTQIESEQFSKDETKFELYDAQAALVQIMKVHNLTTKTIIESDTPIIIQTGMDLDEL